ncbi:MAG: LysE family translocator [Bacteroidia bacterium]
MIINLIYPTIIIVLLLSFSFGPAFFALLNISIKYGSRAGSLLATGVILSDLFVCTIVIYLINLGATKMIQDEKNQHFMGILAGIILIVIGAFYFKKQVASSNETIMLKGPSSTSLILQGFFLNLVNPAVWVLWLGNITAVSKDLDYSNTKMFIYFGITLGLVWGVEILKAKLAGKIKRYLTEKIMRIINYCTGSLLIVFGLFLIYTHFFAVK